MPNTEAAALLRNPAFRAEAARRFQVDVPPKGATRFGKSAVFYAALDALAHNIALGGAPSVAFTYGEWATIGNTRARRTRRIATTAEGAGAAFRTWASESSYVPKSGPLRVRLVFDTPVHRGGNTPGLASVTVYFRDAENRPRRLEKRDDAANYASIYLFGRDEVLESQANALVTYARSKRLARLFTWPYAMRTEPDYQVELLTPADVTRRQSSRRGALTVAALLPVLPMLFGGWYAHERQTLRDLVEPGTGLLIQRTPLCRDGVPSVELQIVLTGLAETVYLVRSERRPDSARTTLGTFRRGTDYDIVLDARSDPDAPTITFRKAISYKDRDVTPGHKYYYNVSVRSVLGEEFVFMVDPPAVVVPSCP